KTGRSASTSRSWCERYPRSSSATERTEGGATGLLASSRSTVEYCRLDVLDRSGGRNSVGLSSPGRNGRVRDGAQSGRPPGANLDFELALLFRRLLFLCRVGVRE